MNDEEELELQILNTSNDYINKIAIDVIKGLTSKALTISMDEKERIAMLGRREGLMNFVQYLNERRKSLVAKKQKES